MIGGIHIDITQRSTARAFQSIQRFLVAIILFHVLCVLLGLLSTPRVGAEVVTLNPVADTFILDSDPNNNNGGTEGFTVGRDDSSGVRRGLIRFNLGTIPRGSVIKSATLEMTVTKDPPQQVSTNFHLFRLLAEWGEGDKVGFRPGNSGAPATTGESSWNARLAGMADWTTPGALDDVVTSPSASTFVTTTGPYAWTGSGVMADVQLWVGQPATNFGWLVVCADELSPMTARKFGSREPSSNPAPPELRIEFVPPPVLSAPRIISQSGFQFTVESVANVTNVVWVSTNSSDLLSWWPIQTLVPTNATFLVLDTNAASDSFRLYQVVVYE